jgi:hypothetical protein
MKANLPLAVTASAVKPHRSTTVRAPRAAAPKIAPRHRVTTNSRLKAEASKRTRATSVYQPARASRLPEAAPATKLVLPPTKSAADKVVLNTAVAERPTGEISFGGGYSTDAGFLLDAGIRERNLLGTGIDTRVGGTLAQRRRDVLRCRQDQVPETQFCRVLQR